MSIVQQSPAGASAPFGQAQFEEAHAGTGDTEDSDAAATDVASGADGAGYKYGDDLDESAACDGRATGAASVCTQGSSVEILEVQMSEQIETISIHSSSDSP